jgi:proline dehydrogenase
LLRRIARPAALVDHAVVRLLPVVPRRLVRRFSEPYIAGAQLEDALRVVGRANTEGKLATIDVLGEHVTSPAEATAMAWQYDEVLDAIHRVRLDANVSVKLSGFGLRIGYDLCRDNLVRVVEHARRLETFARIESEEEETLDETFALYRELRAAGHDNIGMVLQASLRRTLADIAALADLRPNVRLVKGIYVESPEIQFRDFEAVRASYVQSLDALLDVGCYVALATHDDWLIEQSLERVRRRGLGRDRYEFQFLLGVKAALANRLVADGHRLRVYVPFGRQWYAYSLRRLQENPKIARYVAGDTLGRVLGREHGGK